MSDKNFVWVLTERCKFTEGEDIEKMSTAVYSDFETAKRAMRHRLQKHSTAVNLAFDGTGGIRGFWEYINEHTGEEFIFDDEDEAKTEAVKGMPAILKNLFLGYTVTTPPDFEWTDWMTECKYSGDSGAFEMYGVDDGPCNGVDPKIYINIFDMSDPDKAYIVQIRNKGLEHMYSEEYGEYCLTLVKTEVDTPWENTFSMEFPMGSSMEI